MRQSLLSSIALALAVVPCVAFADAVPSFGPMHDCYVQAKSGTDPSGGVAVCSEALMTRDLSASERASLLINRAQLYSFGGDPTSAMADYTAAIATGARVAEAYTNRSATQISLLHYADAIHDADEALRLNTARPEIAYFNRAVANEKLGNIKNAYEDYKAALAAKPGFTAAAENLTRFKVVKSGA